MIALSRLLLPSTLSALLVSTAGWAGSGSLDVSRWTLEAGTREPSYAATVPVATNLNIDAVVLGCERIGRRSVLQLQLYTSDDGPLRSLDATAGSLEEDPKAEVAIDGRVFPVALLFADDYAVLADDQDGPVPLLSNRLLDAMQSGKTMALRFDLMAAASARSKTSDAEADAEAIVNLRSSGAQEAIAAMRHCSERPPPLGAGAAVVTH